MSAVTDGDTTYWGPEYHITEDSELRIRYGMYDGMYEGDDKPVRAERLTVPLTVKGGLPAVGIAFRNGHHADVTSTETYQPGSHTEHHAGPFRNKVQCAVTTVFQHGLGNAFPGTELSVPQVIDGSHVSGRSGIDGVVQIVQKQNVPFRTFAGSTSS